MEIIPRKFYLDDVFDNFITTNRNEMKCDIYEKDGNYHIEMDVPGYNKNDISIEVKDGYLTVTAEKKEEENVEEKNYIKRERVYGKYQRSFYLGELDSDNVEASFVDGTLKVVIPKKEVTENKKVIEIK